jgi:hypothetical protein
MPINLITLQITQSWVRSMSQVKRMTEHVRNGGVFTIENVPEFHPEDSVFPLVRISRFPDGGLYLHDGHHRAVSIWLGGREYLLPEEYEIQDWDSINRYSEINLAANWITPVNLKTEVRLPDTRVYKRLIQETPAEYTIELINNLKHMYATERRHGSVVELADAIAKSNDSLLRTKPNV